MCEHDSDEDAIVLISQYFLVLSRHFFDEGDTETDRGEVVELVYCVGLENRSIGNGTEGSNPSLSARLLGLVKIGQFAPYIR